MSHRANLVLVDNHGYKIFHSHAAHVLDAYLFWGPEHAIAFFEQHAPAHQSWYGTILAEGGALIDTTRKIVMLRYCEFNRVENGQIVETASFCDIPHLMAQAGQDPFGPATAAHLVQPGPLGHCGLLHDAQPPEEGVKTLATINAMINDLGTWGLGLPLEEELARTWADDMIWWGPHGIGATYTIARYAKQHSGPFRAGFTDRAKTRHLARLAEGHFGGFFGWPNFTARPAGGFMGLPATDRLAEFRVIDLYRRDGDKLAENWVFIDMLHVMKTQGVDILGRMSAINGA